MKRVLLFVVVLFALSAPVASASGPNIWELASMAVPEWCDMGGFEGWASYSVADLGEGEYEVRFFCVDAGGGYHYFEQTIICWGCV